MLRSTAILFAFLFFVSAFSQSPVRYSGYFETLRIEGTDELSWEREARWELKDKAQVADFEIRIPLAPQVELDEAEVIIYNQLGEEVAYFEAADFQYVNRAGSESLLQSTELLLSPVINTYPIKVSMRLSMTSEQSMILPDFQPIDAYNQAVDSVSFTLLVDPDLTVDFKDHAMGKMQAGNEDGLKRYYWERVEPNAAPYKAEVYAPDFRERVPYVQVALEEFEFAGESGRASNWSEWGDFVRSLMRPEEVEFIPELLDDISYEGDSNATAAENVFSLYEWVMDDYRFMDLPLQSSGFQPLSLGNVWMEEKGNALSLAFLLKEVLKRYDIESHYGLVHKGQGNISTDFIHQAFDHVVLIVPVEEGDLICDFSTGSDPTYSFHPKYWGDHWLKLDPAGAQLRSMPERPNKSMSYQSLESLDSANTEDLYRYELGIKEALAAELAFLDALGVTEQDRYLNDLIAVNYQIKDIAINSSNNAKKTQLKAVLEMDGIFRPSGKRLLLNTRILQGLLPQLPLDTARQSPIDIGAKRQTVYNISLKLPDGYALPELPASRSVEGPYGVANLSYNLNQEKRLLNITLESTFKSGLYGREEYEDLRDFLKDINQLPEPNLILSPAE